MSDDSYNTTNQKNAEMLYVGELVAAQTVLHFQRAVGFADEGLSALLFLSPSCGPTLAPKSEELITEWSLDQCERTEAKSETKIGNGYWC